MLKTETARTHLSKRPVSRNGVPEDGIAFTGHVINGEYRKSNDLSGKKKHFYRPGTSSSYRPTSSASNQRQQDPQGELINESTNYVNSNGKVQSGSIFKQLKTKLLSLYNDESILKELARAHELSLSDLKKLKKRIKVQFPSGAITQEMVSKSLKTNRQSRSLVNRVMEVLDKNKDGKVSIVEYLEGMIRMSYGSEEERLEMVFRVFDIDNSSSLSMQELYRILDTVTDIQSKSKKKIISRKLFKKLDVDKDGFITLDEFKRINETDEELA
eukprot:CAMPEP_0117430482 /NCGR_PEP_ID=MMETSP0758-20121206/10025_1 /TAXON_ID=63605 /ORGANISM="Percolomonas cosmopolitus, Strain AE-1 (ATCC 50343)" /LENGTH=270 /DNA_ID=CAMNT_0005218553 /DNA_START=38 /DNA_END=846 /DNA_ORIENTATION=-